MNATPSTAASSVTDKELVALAKGGGHAAFTTLSERYMPLLKNRAGRYSKLAGADAEDFYQEGMLALYRAVQSYNENLGVKFSTYAIACIDNSMATAIKKHMRRIPEDSGVSIESAGEDTIVDKEAIDAISQNINSLLSNFERQVLKLYLSGHSYFEISKLLSTSTKAVDNALQRVRRKLRPAL